MTESVTCTNDRWTPTLYIVTNNFVDIMSNTIAM